MSIFDSGGICQVEVVLLMLLHMCVLRTCTPAFTSVTHTTHLRFCARCHVGSVGLAWYRVERGEWAVEKVQMFKQEVSVFTVRLFQFRFHKCDCCIAGRLGSGRCLALADTGFFSMP